MIPFNGKFTIESPKGGHKTFQIKTLRNGQYAGSRQISLFIGRENTNDKDYKPFGWVNDDAIRIFRNLSWDSNNVYDKYAKIFWDLLVKGEKSQLYGMGYRLLIEKKCRVCNRPLTNPESNKSGIGPECAGRRTKNVDRNPDWD